MRIRVDCALAGSGSSHSGVTIKGVLYVRVRVCKDKGPGLAFVKIQDNHVNVKSSIRQDVCRAVEECSVTDLIVSGNDFALTAVEANFCYVHGAYSISIPARSQGGVECIPADVSTSRLKTTSVVEELSSWATT